MKKNWFSVRCIFRYPELVKEYFLYEERITLWETKTLDNAITLAEEEAQRYSKEKKIRYEGLAQAYFTNIRSPKSGSEIFSLMREDDYSAEEYLKFYFLCGTEWQKNEYIKRNPDKKSWFSVRCIFSHPELIKKDFLYEERITLWKADNQTEAIEKAKKEARKYSKEYRCEYIGLNQVFNLNIDELKSSSEVFSLMRYDDFETEDYIDTYFNIGTERQKE